MFGKKFGTRKAAERLGVSPVTVRRYVDEGMIAAYRVGPRRILKFTDGAIRAFLMNHRAVNSTSDFKTLAANDSAEM